MRLLRTSATAAIFVTLAVQALGQELPTNPGHTPPPANTPAEDTGRRRIGLVLGGGGALGLTEIGVLKWMEENHIPVDVIAGTSMGCMMSAFYAVGKTPDEIAAITTDGTLNKVFRIGAEYKTLSFRRRDDERRIPGSFTFGLRKGLSLPRSGVLTDSDLNEFLAAQFLSYGDTRDFNSLPIPLRCVATDIRKGEMHVFRDGSLATAVRASISIPGVFPAYDVGDHLYVDGAIMQNLPVETERDELKPDVIIAVSIPLEKETGNSEASLFGVLGRTFSVASWANEQRSRKLADVVLSPQTGQLSAADYAKSKDLIEIGYKAAEAQCAALLKYRVSGSEWAAYDARRHGRVPPPPKFIGKVEVTSNTPEIQKAIQGDLNVLQGQPLNALVINQKLEEIRSDGRLNASYSVTRPASEDGATVHVNVKDKPGGPPFLLLGLNIVAQSGPAPSRATLEATYLHQDLWGYRNELRGKMSFGYNTNLDFEYYKSLNNKGLFVAPRGFYFRTPVYIFQNEQTLAQRTSTRAGGGVDIGYSIDQKAEFRAGWEIFYQKWKTKTGTDGLPDLTGVPQLVRAQYSIDRQDRALIPRHGFRGTINAGYLFNAPSGENAPRITASGSYFLRTWLGNSVSFGGEGGTMMNYRVSEPLLFSLGGPLRLSASAQEEYRGTDYWLFRPMYLRKIFTLPAPLNMTNYIFVSPEIGQMRSPYLPSVTRGDIFFGITAETPLGVLTLGPAFGNEGQKKLNFSLGRFF